MILLPGLLPATLPMWAVFADELGNPVFEPVVCFGVFEIDEKGRRLVSAFSQGTHVESADFKENFVALTTDDRDEEVDREWQRRTKVKRAELAKAARESKIHVPANGVSGVFGEG